jgi:hypothetical protein
VLGQLHGLSEKSSTAAHKLACCLVPNTGVPVSIVVGLLACFPKFNILLQVDLMKWFGMFFVKDSFYYRSLIYAIVLVHDMVENLDELHALYQVIFAYINVNDLRFVDLISSSLRFTD